MSVRRAASAALIATLIIVGSTAVAPTLPAGAVTLSAGQNYVALGDSITAGAIPYYQYAPGGQLWAFGEWVNSGFSSWAHLCGRSTNNPWAARVKTSITGTGTSQYRLGACSGATTAHLTSGQTADTVVNGIQTINQRQDNYIDANTRAVTITIGGNDAQILGLIDSCIKGACYKGNEVPGGGWREWNSIFTTTPSGGPSIQSRISSAYDAVAAKLPAGAKVNVVLYSSFVVDPTLNPAAAGDCAASMNVDATDATYIAQKTRDLNQAAINAAAGRTGWSVVDTYTPSQLPARHDACAPLADRWIANPGTTEPYAGQAAGIAWTPTGTGQVYPLHLNDNGHTAFANIVGPALAAS